MTRFLTIFTAVLFLLIAQNVFAQEILIHLNNGNTERIHISDIDRITFEDGNPPQEREFELANGVMITMVWIPAGEFDMGSPENEPGRHANEGPVHHIAIDYGFWMGKYEVTQEQWEAVTGENPSRNPVENHPVERVSWTVIHEDFLDQIDNRFRLPSESEWEYACRAGTQTRFYWGDDPNLARLNDYAVLHVGGHAEVGSKRPNAWGLYDMIGNVNESCEDYYHESYHDAPNDGSPWIDPATDYRVRRGGSYASDNIRYYRCAYRDMVSIQNGDSSIGFRLVRDAD